MPSSLAVSFAGYKRSWLMADVLAGLTLVAIAVPEQIATAKLASMPAVTGLWAFVVGSLMIAVLGRSAHVSVGADSTIAPVLAAGVASVAASGARATELTSFVAVAVGVVVIGAGLLKFGWIADFLSAPVIAGLLAGIGVEIVVRQLPVVLGVPAEGTTTVDQLRHVVANIGSANGWTIVLAALVLVIIFGAERADTGRLVGVVADPGAANQPHALMTSSVVTPPTTSKSVWPMRHRPLRRSRSTQTHTCRRGGRIGRRRRTIPASSGRASWRRSSAWAKPWGRGLPTPELPSGCSCRPTSSTTTCGTSS